MSFRAASSVSRRGDGADADSGKNPAARDSAPGPRRDDDAGNRTFGAPSPSAVAAAALTLRRFALEFGLENSNAARSIAAKWPVGVLDRERLLRRADALGPAAEAGGSSPRIGVAADSRATAARLEPASSPCAAPASRGAPA